MFVTLSCSGLPDQSSCTFTPENIEILPNATAAYTSSMVVQTQQQEGFLARPRSNGVALAILLPGMLGLGGLAFAVRRRAWLQRLSLLALVALVASLGTTACNARYDYYNHGPPINPATPAGTYTVEGDRAVQQRRDCHHQFRNAGLHRPVATHDPLESPSRGALRAGRADTCNRSSGVPHARGDFGAAAPGSHGCSARPFACLPASQPAEVAYPSLPRFNAP